VRDKGEERKEKRGKSKPVVKEEKQVKEQAKALRFVRHLHLRVPIFSLSIFSSPILINYFSPLDCFDFLIAFSPSSNLSSSFTIFFYFLSFSVFFGLFWGFIRGAGNQRLLCLMSPSSYR